MFKKKQINDFEITPIDSGAKKFTKKNVRGWNLFQYPYGTTCVVARSTGGKTTLLLNIAKSCIGPNTKVLIFSSTIDTDDKYIKFKKELLRNDLDVEVYNSINGEIDELIDELKSKNEQEQSGAGVSEPEPVCHKFTLEPVKPVQTEAEKKKKDKMISPEYLIIIDDLSNELRNKSINNLTQVARQFKIRALISIHDKTSLMPSAWRSVMYLLLLPKISVDKINEFAQVLNLSFEDDRKGHSCLVDLYKDATKGKYDFLYIDRMNNEYRRNFKNQYIFE